ncbi:hypothetical protein IFM61606_07841 [Aspergillus udagawae]|uniref:Uncharacterized protein n=1 Tax=Aspergillus udagawae TaxID=91492 RepID=A0ABQ1A4S6_9EURO|nr:hypothetical protein IFM51744_01565 [Aspergillus udagawae]GFF73542.1 hypothetical protein IFM53868_01094 [Aspergillus udagawae]GFG27784.1 hypothetical protein IFM61606_07841 [Aspergillus udagawae]
MAAVPQFRGRRQDDFILPARVSAVAEKGPENGRYHAGRVVFDLDSTNVDAANALWGTVHEYAYVNRRAQPSLFGSRTAKFAVCSTASNIAKNVRFL